MSLFADTIYAAATARGMAGVAVIRVSGAGTRAIIEALTHKPCPRPRRAALRRFQDAHGTTLDEGLLLYFEGPRSFTGEDVAEFHLHGSAAVIAAFYEALAAFPGARMALPGEFTQRAFLNGKLDLAQVEGLADLIAAQTERQRAQAVAQMGGALSQLYEGWRARLLHALAHIEAAIDFSDEGLPPDLTSAALAGLRELERSIAAHLSDAHRGERLRGGFSVAVLGAPNAGKSSLVNAVSRREAAIVSARAGTTRDVIEVHLDIAGYPLILADTAGLRAAQDDIEAEGVRRAHARARDADLTLILFDATRVPDAQSRALIDARSFILLNKIDRCGPPDLARWRSVLGIDAGTPLFPVSAATGEGVAPLLAALGQRLDTLTRTGQNEPPLTRPRHREALIATRDSLTAALAAQAQARPPELVAEDLRRAAHALARITGRADVEDLLDIIFRDFCIGK